MLIKVFMDCAMPSSILLGKSCCTAKEKFTNIVRTTQTSKEQLTEQLFDLLSDKT